MAATCVLLYALNQGNAHALLITLAFGLLPLSGAVIIARQPRNPVGWLAAAIGFTFVGGDVLAQYGTYALITHPSALPLGGLAAWTATWSWMIVYSLAIPFLLLIPNGRLLSRRWLALIWAGVATGLPVVVYIQVQIAPVDKVSLLKSQYLTTQVGLGGLLIWKVLQVWQPLQFLLILLATIGLFERFTRSQGVERQQLKWIFLAITTIPVAAGLGLLIGNNNNSLLNDVYQVVNLLAPCSFPVALAIAVTRYRLYDIDVIIRRTLIYAALTASLALIFFGSVILFQLALTAMSGQRSAAVTVISTLLIAALFTPLRRRIQSDIDRRFYRRKYDAAQAIERFVATVRQETDLEQLSTGLLAVVAETMQPESVSLWLKQTEDR